ncbi:MAG: PPC domain-containing DNA-binding protein [Bacteroidales bacterium]
MKQYGAVFLMIMGWILFHGDPLYGQQTRTEVVKPTTPEQDARPNSDTVPEVVSIEGDFTRIEVLRFKYKADLLTGLQEQVETLGITNGVILAGIGSVRDYHVHSVSNREFPSRNVYIRDPSAPADITSMNGYIIEGRVHVHITLASEDRAFGGHLEEGTHVFTFAIVTIGVFPEGTDLDRVDDKTYR